MLVFEPRPAPATARTTLVFRPSPPSLPLNIVIDGLRPGESTWPFALAPVVRTGFSFAGVVKSVRFATVHSFGEGGVDTVRVDVELEGQAPLALEGSSVMMGPVAPPEPTRPTYS